MSFWYCMFPKWHNSSGVDHWSFWVDLTASICNGSRAKALFLRYAALVMVMSYLWWPTCEQPTDSASLFSSFGARARRSAGKASLQRQGMRFVFWECYTRRRIYFLNGQSDNDTRPLEEEKKKSRCLCSSLRRTQDLRRSWRTERTPGLQRAPLAQLMLHIWGLETKTLRGAPWWFTQAISRPLNPLTVIKLHLLWPRAVCPSLRPPSCRCFLKQTSRNWLTALCAHPAGFT